MAAEGDTEAKKTMGFRQKRGEPLLKSEGQLPELEGYTELHFVWDFEWSRDRDAVTLIRLKDGKAVWKELACFGGESRFEEVREMLKKKYGDRFKSIEVNFKNDDCGYYYYGD